MVNAAAASGPLVEYSTTSIPIISPSPRTLSSGWRALNSFRRPRANAPSLPACCKSPSASMASIPASAAAHDTGFPPKVNP